MQQDYGGFSRLTVEQKKEILELVFGRDGLDIDILKMFLDPWHQIETDGPFDHKTTASNMLYFVENGIQLAGERGKEIDVITTLYGPPAWATKQKIIGGRDFDESRGDDLADSILDWVVFLRDKGINVKYVSIHNEGEDFYRWDFQDGTQRLERFDYNMYWPPEQVNRFVILLAGRIKSRRLGRIGVSNGEPSNWTRFYNWGYASSLYENDEALDNLGLLTTHGFINGDYDKLSYAVANGLTTRLLRSEKPDLHAWITSMSWGERKTKLIKMIHEHIYTAGVNTVIPWAGIQNSSSWIGGDPNPGTAIAVHDDGTNELTAAYYLYKQLTRAGHKGMAVVRAELANPVSNIIAFAGNQSGHPDAFVVTSSIVIWTLPFEIEIRGTEYEQFRAFRSTQDGKEKFDDLGIYQVENGTIIYDAPYGSVTTFIGAEKHLQ